MVEPLLIVVTSLWAAALTCHFTGWLVSKVSHAYAEVCRTQPCMIDRLRKIQFKHNNNAFRAINGFLNATYIAKSIISKSILLDHL